MFEKEELVESEELVKFVESALEDLLHSLEHSSQPKNILILDLTELINRDI